MLRMRAFGWIVALFVGVGLPAASSAIGVELPAPAAEVVLPDGAQPFGLPDGAPPFGLPDSAPIAELPEAVPTDPPASELPEPPTDLDLPDGAQPFGLPDGAPPFGLPDSAPIAELPEAASIVLSDVGDPGALALDASLAPGLAEAESATLEDASFEAIETDALEPLAAARSGSWNGLAVPEPAALGLVALGLALRARRADA